MYVCKAHECIIIIESKPASFKPHDKRNNQVWSSALLLAVGDQKFHYPCTQEYRSSRLVSKHMFVNNEVWSSALLLAVGDQNSTAHFDEGAGNNSIYTVSSLNLR